MHRFGLCAFGCVLLLMQQAGAQVPGRAPKAVDEKTIVDCALPPQVRKLNAQTTTQMPGNVVRLSRGECDTRGGAYSMPAAARELARTSSIVAAQKKLGKLGFDPGPPDGVVGGKTSAALRRFQGERNLAVTGKLDDASMHELQK